jgi:hypothetical protein
MFLGSLLQSVEIGNVDTIGAHTMALHGTVNKRGGIGRHVGSWCRTLIPRQVRATGFTLALLTRGGGQAHELRLLGKNFGHFAVVLDDSEST